MKLKISVFLFVFILFLGTITSGAKAAVIDLFDWGVNTDNEVIVKGDVPPFDLPNAALATYDTSAFSFITGLGSITTTVPGVGSHYSILFLNHDIDFAINGELNEFGATSGTPAATPASFGDQTWEIDDPLFGDIFANVTVNSFGGPSALDNFNAIPFATGFDDVSMALGWDFTGTASQPGAIMTFNVSTTAPTSGFFLSQTDPDSALGRDGADPVGSTIYFSSTIKPIPEPTTFALMGIGLVGLVGAAARKRLRLKRDGK